MLLIDHIFLMVLETTEMRRKLIIIPGDDNVRIIHWKYWNNEKIN